MKNRNLSRILSSWVFLRYDEELTSWRRSPVARGVTVGRQLDEKGDATGA
jgi:hypothetical protein